MSLLKIYASIIMTIEVLLLCNVSVASSSKLNAANGNQTRKPCSIHFTKLDIFWSDFAPYLSNNLTPNADVNQPVGNLHKHLELSTTNCCPTLNLRYRKININSSDDIELAVRKHRTPNVAFFFPVFANRDAEKRFDRKFIHLYKSPGLSVFEIEPPESIDIAIQQWYSLLSSAMFLSHCALTAVLAGIIMWALDSRTNKEFPNNFFSGSGAGIWWSFVTMTTVGYGDKSPKSTIGRIFAVFWMILGTILLSMFSARITAGLSSFEIGVQFSLVGKAVAVPLGMQNFLENELNLGADYQEVSQSSITDRLMGEENKLQFPDDVSYAISHDYEATRIFSFYKNKSMSTKVKETIKHRLSLGMVVAGDLDKMEDFFQCWERELVDNIAIQKVVERTRFRNSNNSHNSIVNSDLQTGLKITIAMSACIAVLFVLGCLSEIFKRIKHRTLPVSQAGKDGDL